MNGHEEKQGEEQEASLHSKGRSVSGSKRHHFQLFSLLSLMRSTMYQYDREICVLISLRLVEAISIFQSETMREEETKQKMANV